MSLLVGFSLLTLILNRRIGFSKTNVLYAFSTIYPIAPNAVSSNVRTCFGSIEPVLCGFLSHSCRFSCFKLFVVVLSGYHAGFGDFLIVSSADHLNLRSCYLIDRIFPIEFGGFSADFHGFTVNSYDYVLNYAGHFPITCAYSPIRFFHFPTTCVTYTNCCDRQFAPTFIPAILTYAVCDFRFLINDFRFLINGFE